MAPKHVIQEVNGLSCFEPSVSFNLALIPFSLHSRACFISVMIFSLELTLFANNSTVSTIRLGDVIVRR